MDHLYEDAVQEGFLAVIELGDVVLPERMRSVIEARIARFLLKEVEQEDIKLAWRYKVQKESLPRHDDGEAGGRMEMIIAREILLSQAEIMLRELGFVDTSMLRDRLKALGVNLPRRTFYHWLREWGKSRRLRFIRGYIPSDE